jgi:aminocarboxymuconate-semialdehyde decarboxylase
VTTRGGEDRSPAAPAGGDGEAAGPPLRVDVHAHLCAAEVPDFAEHFGDARWPVVRPQADGALAIMRDGHLYRPIDDRYFGAASRIRFLDAHGIDIQVVSPLPVLLPHWAPPAEATEVARWLNASVAEHVAQRPDRLVGLGTIAPHDPASTSAVLDQIVDLGLAGIEIGTTYGGAELGDGPVVELFAEAAERGIPVLIHPLEGAGMGRLDDALVRFSVGVMSDTSLAAASLLIAGVLVDHPSLRICLSHGGGSFFWILPRLERMLVGAVGADRGRELVAAIERVWVDSASLGVENLDYIEHRIGLDRFVIGSDFPAAAGMDPGAALREAGHWTHPSVCHENVERFLGRRLVRPAGKARPHVG